MMASPMKLAAWLLASVCVAAPLLTQAGTPPPPPSPATPALTGPAQHQETAGEVEDILHQRALEASQDQHVDQHKGQTTGEDGEPPAVDDAVRK